MFLLLLLYQLLPLLLLLHQLLQAHLLRTLSALSQCFRVFIKDKLEKHVYALSQAADKYVIPHLLKHCERYLLSSLSTSNALETLEIADTCSNHNLKETTLNFLVKNIEHMVPSPKFETFVHRSPHLTVQLVTRAFVNGAK